MPQPWRSTVQRPTQSPIVPALGGSRFPPPQDWRPVLQGKAHQTGDDVVEPDDLSGTVRAVDSKKEFTGVGFVINTEVERALPRDADFLGDVTATSREGYKDSHMIFPASRCFSSIIIRLCVDHGRPTREQVLFVRRLANGSRDDLVPN